MTEQTQVPDTGTVTPGTSAPSATPSATTGGTTPFKIYATQEDFDGHAAGIKSAAIKDAEKELLKSLGITDKTKLATIKAAYEASLSAEQIQSELVVTLQRDNAKLSAEIDEKDFTIAALTVMSGKSSADVTKVVKMARGLREEGTPIEDVIKEVVGMITPAPATTGTATATPPANMPKGTQIVQPDKPLAVEVNPFKKETVNLTEQGRLVRTDPEKARRLAKEAGWKNITF